MASQANSCCNLGVIEDPVDYSQQAGNAYPFLERVRIVPTYRNPSARIEPAAWLVHSAPMQPPLPLPALQQHLNGSPPPDRAETHEWPHPAYEEELT